METLESFLDVYSTRQLRIFEERRTVQTELSDLRKRIEDIEKIRNSQRADTRSTSVNVVLLAKEDGSAELVLSYGEYLR